MNNSDPVAPSPLINSGIAKMKESPPFSQVISVKASSMQGVIQVMQRALEKSYMRACQLFCLPLHSLSCKKAVCCSARTHQPKEEENTQAPLWSPPSTILIINISNSTLTDCVIGNDTGPSAVAERQPLMQEPNLHLHNHMWCSCSSGQQSATQTTAPPPPPHLPSTEYPSISIQRSHLNCVIIGHNNYMHADQSQPFDTEEP